MVLSSDYPYEILRHIHHWAEKDRHPKCSECGGISSRYWTMKASMLTTLPPPSPQLGKGTPMSRATSTHLGPHPQAQHWSQGKGRFLLSCATPVKSLSASMCSFLRTAWSTSLLRKVFLRWHQESMETKLINDDSMEDEGYAHPEEQPQANCTAKQKKKHITLYHLFTQWTAWSRPTTTASLPLIFYLKGSSYIVPFTEEIQVKDFLGGTEAIPVKAPSGHSFSSPTFIPFSHIVCGIAPTSQAVPITACLLMLGN